MLTRLALGLLATLSLIAFFPSASAYTIEQQWGAASVSCTVTPAGVYCFGILCTFYPGGGLLPVGFGGGQTVGVGVSTDGSPTTGYTGYTGAFVSATGHCGG